MANPLFGLLNKTNNKSNSMNIGGNNVFTMFQNFVQQMQMQGKNPHQVLQELIQAHGISPEQLNIFKAKTNEILSGGMNKG